MAQCIFLWHAVLCPDLEDVSSFITSIQNGLSCSSTFLIFKKCEEVMNFTKGTRLNQAFSVNNLVILPSLYPGRFLNNRLGLFLLMNRVIGNQQIHNTGQDHKASMCQTIVFKYRFQVTTNHEKNRNQMANQTNPHMLYHFPAIYSISRPFPEIFLSKSVPCRKAVGIKSPLPFLNHVPSTNKDDSLTGTCSDPVRIKPL